jgi:hypothetical protein
MKVVASTAAVRIGKAMRLSSSTAAVLDAHVPISLRLVFSALALHAPKLISVVTAGVIRRSWLACFVSGHGKSSVTMQNK